MSILVEIKWPGDLRSPGGFSAEMQSSRKPRVLFVQGLPRRWRRLSEFCSGLVSCLRDSMPLRELPLGQVVPAFVRTQSKRARRLFYRILAGSMHLVSILLSRVMVSMHNIHEKIVPQIERTKFGKARARPSAKKLDKSHPDHTPEITRIRKVTGQLEGIEKMIFGRRHCPDILQQVQAAISALNSLKLEILKRHLDECLMESGRTADFARLTEQVLEVVQIQTRK